MIGGGARISRDIAPFTLATERNALIGLNVVGLRRRGIKREVLNELKRAFRLLDSPVGNLRALAAQSLKDGTFASPEAQRFLAFYAAGRRTFARRRRAGEAEDAQSE
jgi:UDP-N-acetylglucosamine acyltransferase